jgi:hypothetical protein
MTAPTEADLTAAYNDFLAAMGELLQAAAEAALDPETAASIAELAVAIPSVVLDGVEIGGCILEALP